MNKPNRTEHRFPALAAPLLLIAAMATSSCMSDPYGSYQAAPPVQRGALTGAVAGGVIGGIAREDVGGVAVGAALGALAGAATGQAMENARRRNTPPPGYGNAPPQYPRRPQAPAPPYPPREDNRDYRPVNPAPAPAPPRAPSRAPSEPQYPTAKKTGEPGRVISPYPPNNMIDVEGFQPGDLAIDPTTEKIFRIP